MATKGQPSAASGAVPQISLVDQLLSSRIALPATPTVHYTLYAADTNSTFNPTESIETARRNILAQNASSALLDSILTSVHIGLTSFLYVFRISDTQQAAQTTNALTTLCFDGLTVVKSSSFVLANLFPCSQACSLQETPCSNCKDTTSPITAKSSSPSTLFPRTPLQTTYSHFLEAIRNRLLDDIANAAVKDPSRRHVKRLKGGFLLVPSMPGSEWTSGWEYRTLSRPLLYCQLQVHLSWQPQSGTPALIVHPLLRPTQFSPLAYSLPIQSGSPITLLPHGTPAYFLTHYSGPTSALKKQFQESLLGLGVAGWDDALPRAASAINGLPSIPEYIIAWIKVENKQGEDKGIIVIYPTALCLSFIPSSTTRPMLEYIPELPSPLQPSPLLSAAVVAASRGQTVTSPVEGSARPSPITSAPPPSAYPAIPPNSQILPPRPVLPSSPTCESLRAFRSLTLSKSKDIRTVADKVSTYVDAIARERDKERERLKRERETGASSSPKLTKNATNANAQTPAAPASSTPSFAHAPPLSIPSTSHTYTTTSLLTTPLTNMPQPPAPLASQISTPGQHFYPSPPHADSSIVPPTGAVVSPATEAAPTLPSSTQPKEEVPEAKVPSETSPEPAAAPTYGPYNNSDNSWQSKSYLGMDMDIDFDMGMDIGFDMDSGAGTGRGDGLFDAGDNSMDFEAAFTDDDFNFFDGPVAPPRGGNMATANANTNAGSVARPQNVTNNQIGHGLPSSFGLSSPSPMSQPTHAVGPTHSFQVPPTPQSHTLTSPSPWVASANTPGFGDVLSAGLDLNPRSDLFPLSPGQTPSTMQTHSVPETPQVSVHLKAHQSPIRRPSLSGTNFDAIPFSEYHSKMDGKYAVGKFSLPSPPPEGDEDRVPAWPWPPPPPSTGSSTSSVRSPFLSRSASVGSGLRDGRDGWRARYLAVTDPRIGVVKKLIGVKRKLAFEPGGRETGRNVQPSPSWIRELEDWQQHGDPEADTPEAIPDDDSDDDSVDDLPEESPAMSRPSTPLPHYLPLGPTLLHTHFRHNALLPLSKPLRPPGAAVAPTNITASSAALSVPTPMSPAAGLGAANEKSKSLEAAACTVAREVVENPPWAEAWRVSGSVSDGQAPNAAIWPADIRVIGSLLNSVAGCQGPLQLGELFGASAQKSEKATASSSTQLEGVSQKALDRMEAPLVTAAKGNAIIHILPTAVRFWEKLGLGPRGGTKDGTVFALFEDDGAQRQAMVESWLSRVTSIYECKHLGTLTPGKSSQCPKDGILPIRFDSFWKSLASCVASLPPLHGSLIFFVVTPMATMSLASPLLRKVFSAIKKAAKTYSEAQIHFQLIPEHLLHGGQSNPAAAFSDAELVCYSLYDRILVPVNRSMSRRLYDDGERVRRYFQEPIITLAREKYVKTAVEFKRRQVVHLDVMEKGTFLQLGYTISDCGKWVFVACIDQRGESHDLGVWLAGDVETSEAGAAETAGSQEAHAASTKEHLLVSRIWDFAMKFASKANVEWRIVVSRLGVMGQGELNAWAALLDDDRLIRGPPRLHVSLMSVQHDVGWSMCSHPATLGSIKQTPTKTASGGISRSPALLLTSTKAHPNQPQNIFTDVTSIVFAVPAYSHLPQTQPIRTHNLGPEVGYIPEDDNMAFSSTLHPSTPTSQPWILDQIHRPHPIPIQPRLSSTMICVLANAANASNIGMLHLHLLYSTDNATSTLAEQKELQEAIVNNFHDLSALSALRWRLGPSFITQCNGSDTARARACLPFQLGAVEVMKSALARDLGLEKSSGLGSGPTEGESGDI